MNSVTTLYLNAESPLYLPLIEGGPSPLELITARLESMKPKSPALTAEGILSAELSFLTLGGEMSAEYFQPPVSTLQLIEKFMRHVMEFIKDEWRVIAPDLPNPTMAPAMYFSRILPDNGEPIGLYGMELNGENEIQIFPVVLDKIVSLDPEKPAIRWSPDAMHLADVLTDYRARLKIDRLPDTNYTVLNLASETKLYKLIKPKKDLDHAHA